MKVEIKNVDDAVIFMRAKGSVTQLPVGESVTVDAASIGLCAVNPDETASDGPMPKIFFGD